MMLPALLAAISIVGLIGTPAAFAATVAPTNYTDVSPYSSGDFYYPSMSDDGHVIAFEGHLGSGAEGIYVSSPGQLGHWVADGYYPTVSGDGSLLLYSGPQSMITVLNLAAGTSTPVGPGYAGALSHNGHWAIASNTSNTMLTRYDLTVPGYAATPTALDASVHPNQVIMGISDDGRYAVFANRARPVQVYLYDFSTSTTTALGANTTSPRISADGSTVVYDDQSEVNSHLSSIQAYSTATGITTNLTPGSNVDAWQPALSANGQYVSYLYSDPNSSAIDLYFAAVNSPAAATNATPLADGDAWESAISNDGRYLAFGSQSYGSVPSYQRREALDLVDTTQPFLFPVPLPQQSNPQQLPGQLGGPDTAGGGSPSTACACAQGQATKNPVNTATGEFWHSFTDFSIPGRGPALNLTRSYSSLLAARIGPFGYGWSSSYGMNLTVDPATAIVAVHQENGSLAEFTPDANGNFQPTVARTLASLVHNADGSWTLTRHRRERFGFNANGQLTSEADLNGNTATLGYTDGSLSSVTDSAGRSLTFTTTNGLITQVTDPAGRTVSYGYDGANNLTAVTDPTGAVWTFGYDSSHRLTSMLDPNQQSAPAPTPLTNTYDSGSRVVSQSDYAGRVTQFDYTTIPGTTLITDPRGMVTAEQYSNGLRTSLTHAYGTPLAATASYSYDPTTLAVASVTDPLGHARTFSYDANGNKTSATDPLGHTQSWTYDGLNDLLTATDATGVTTTRTYDSAGNLRTISTPVNGQTQTSTFLYDDPNHPGDLTSTIDPRGKTWTLSHDNYGQLVASTDPLGHTSTTSYQCAPSGPGCRSNIGWAYRTVSARGNTVGSDPATYTTTVTRDDDGRTLTSTDPLGHTQTSSYDPNGNRTSTTDPNGHTTSYSYDPDNELTATTRADSSTSHTGYDANGNVLTQTDPAGHATSYSYDLLNRLTATTTPAAAGAPAGLTTTFGYDRADRKVSKTDGQGRVTSYGYDNDNRLTTVSYPDSTPNVSYGYDSDNRRTAMTDGTGSSSYHYDALGRLTSSTDGAGHTVSYGYDPAGNATSIGYPNGSTVTRSYDDAGRLSTVSDWNGHTSTFGYDADGNLATITYPNGVTEVSSYNPAQQLTSLADTNGAATLASYTYTRDPLGQLTATTPSGSTGQGPETYGHSTLNQLTTYTSSGTGGSTNGSYSYDLADNLTGTPAGATQTFNAANELLTSTAPGGATSYSYDLQGNRTASSSTLGNRDLSYDMNNQLTQFHTGDNSTTASYRYNGDGLRTAKTVNGVNSAFSWDLTSSNVPLLLTDGTRNYLYGPGGIPLEHIQPRAAITLVGAGQASDLGTSTQLTVTFPTAAAGDQIIIEALTKNPNEASSTSGYTSLPTTGQFLLPQIHLFRRTALGGEHAATFTFSNTPQADYPKVLQAFVYRGVDPNNPVDGTSSAISPTTSSSLTLPAIITTDTGDQLVLTAGQSTSILAPTWTLPSGMTSRGQANATALASEIAADQTLTTAGPTGTRTVTSSGAGPVAGQLLALRRAPDTLYYQHDQQGSTRLLTDPTGAISATFTYDPYGNTLTHTGIADTALLYDGQYQDTESGFYYLRARYYEPMTTQFLTMDPMKPLTHSPYGYGTNEPLELSDPSGMVSCAPHQNGGGCADGSALPPGYDNFQQWSAHLLANYAREDCMAALWRQDASQTQQAADELRQLQAAYLAARRAEDRAAAQADMASVNSGVSGAIYRATATIVAVTSGCLTGVKVTLDYILPAASAAGLPEVGAPLGAAVGCVGGAAMVLAGFDELSGAIDQAMGEPSG
jgi:RHS repeat-associated protein